MRDTLLIVFSAILTSLAFSLLAEAPSQPGDLPVEAWLLVDEFAETETESRLDDTQTLFLYIDDSATSE